MDTLYLLEPEFQDPALPGRFYCRDCILVEGLLAAFPDRTANLRIVRLPYPRPRQAVVAAIGEENQWLPVLVLDHPSAGEVSRSESELASKSVGEPAGGSAQPNPFDVTNSLRDGPSAVLSTGGHQPPRFINEIGTLLAALHERHGFPEPHP